MTPQTNLCVINKLLFLCGQLNLAHIYIYSICLLIIVWLGLLFCYHVLYCAYEAV